MQNFYLQYYIQYIKLLFLRIKHVLLKSLRDLLFSHFRVRWCRKSISSIVCNRMARISSPSMMFLLLSAMLFVLSRLSARLSCQYKVLGGSWCRAEATMQRGSLKWSLGDPVSTSTSPSLPLPPFKLPKH